MDVSAVCSPSLLSSWCKRAHKRRNIDGCWMRWAGSLFIMTICSSHAEPSAAFRVLFCCFSIARNIVEPE
jgi:hypothetical protein